MTPSIGSPAGKDFLFLMRDWRGKCTHPVMTGGGSAHPVMPAIMPHKNTLFSAILEQE